MEFSEEVIISQQSNSFIGKDIYWRWCLSLHTCNGNLIPQVANLVWLLEGFQAVWFQARSPTFELIYTSMEVSKVSWRMQLIGSLKDTPFLTGYAEWRTHMTAQLCTPGILDFLTHMTSCTGLCFSEQAPCWQWAKGSSNASYSWVAPPHRPERDVDSATLPSALELDWAFWTFAWTRGCTFDITCFGVEQCAVWRFDVIRLNH